MTNMTGENKKEIRFSTFTFEKRGEDEIKLIGYASKFDNITTIGGMFREVIRKGAFKRAIQEEQDVRALVDHNPSLILGRTKSKTLSLEEDETGLRVEIILNDTNVGVDTRKHIERGDVDQMSFGFVVRKQSWTAGKDKEPTLREILDVDLFDVSVVTYPAYENTEIGLRMKNDAASILKEYNDTIEAEIAREKLSIDLLELE